MTPPKVLISDQMSQAAEDIFKSRGIDVDVNTSLTTASLKEVIGNYDGLAIRSSTKVTADILSGKGRLKVIGRAGIGVDNVDIKAATNAGIIVMNTPFGNSITTAEHTIAMMMALTRQIPQASLSTHAGKWEKNKFMGQELYGKTLGIIGCGNIGAIVADRALGLKMKVISYDPFLTDERAIELGVTKQSLTELFKNADFITLHTPLIEQTKNIINKDAIALMKKSVRIINCARGGLIDEQALKEALDAGLIAGAALDVFETEPATQNILFGHEKVICTPHLGAATIEAQENVALQVAEQMADYLMQGAITNAVNMTSLSAEDAPKLKPYLGLADKMGRMIGQLSEGHIKNIHLSYEGDVAHLKIKALSAIFVSGLLSAFSDGINTVNALARLKDQGISLSETRNETCADFQTLINVTIETENGMQNISGTLFADGTPRLVRLDHVRIEAEFSPHMVYIKNDDKPGLIGKLGTIFGNNHINIAGFTLGRKEKDRYAIGLITVDQKCDENTLKEIKGLPLIQKAKIISL